MEASVENGLLATETGAVTEGSSDTELEKLNNSVKDGDDLPSNTTTTTEPTETVVTVDMPLDEVAINQASALIPDVTQITLNDFDLTEQAGLSAADVLTLGDLSNMLDLRNMTVGAPVADWQRAQLSALTLDQYDFLNEMTIAQVADIARLHAYTVGEIPIVEKAIMTFLNHPVLLRERKVTLSHFLDRYPEIGSIKLGLLELPKYHYSAIPKLLSVPITSLPNWQRLKVSAVAGLEDIPIHQNLQIEGEIVTLTTARVKTHSEIQLKRNSGFSVSWKESLNSDALQPFGSFFLVPKMVGETIRIDAYFESCRAETSCQFIGPFAYPDYKVGDAFYVSRDDWSAAVAQERQAQAVEFKREPMPTTQAQLGTDPFISKLMMQAAVGALMVIAVGLLLLLLLLSKRRRMKP